MDTNKRLKTVGYTDHHLGFVEEFCQQCKLAGYKNNESIDAMKLDWCLSQGGQFFLTYLDDKIISLSGCHPLSQVSNNVYRILFRGATLPEYQNLTGTLSKTHMNSIPFFYHVPNQISWGKQVNSDTFVVTTNYQNSEIKSMSKSHRVFYGLAKQNIVSQLVERLDLFYTEQAVWQINEDEYFKHRFKYALRQGL
jgi:hypothetical protein